MKLLLIESQPRNQQLIQQVIKPYIQDIDTVFTVEDGKHYIASGLYDIILYGWSIPASMWISSPDSNNVIAIVKELVDDPVIQVEVQSFQTSLPKKLQQLLTIHATTVVGDILIHTPTRMLSKADNHVTLTPLEYTLFQLLAEQQQPMSKVELENNLFGHAPKSNQLEAYVSFLRRKLSSLETTVRITTIRSFGYLLETTKSSE